MNIAIAAFIHSGLGITTAVTSAMVAAIMYQVNSLIELRSQLLSIVML